MGSLLKKSPEWYKRTSLVFENKKNWMTTVEVASYLGRTIGAVRNLVYRGYLKPRKFVGRNYFSREEIDRAIVLSEKGR